MRHLNRDLYFLGRRAMEELRATERARHAGVRAPEVLAATERRRGIAYTATLATRWIPDAVDLSLWIRGRSPVEVSGALFAAGSQLARMHAGGVAHPDVNLRNLLVAGSSGSLLVYLLDFDRARVGDGPVPRGRRSRDLLRLARSARKLRAPIGAAGWAALRDGYGDEWPLDRDLG